MFSALFRGKKTGKGECEPASQDAGSLKSFDLQQDREVLLRVISDAHFRDALPPIHPKVLVDQHPKLLGDLYDLTGFSREDFDSLIVPLLHRFAEYMQLLPASERHHHHSVGGLLWHSLEVAVAAVRLAQGKAFCGSVEGVERATDKVRWPIGCMLGGLGHDLGKAVYDQKVISADGHVTWNPYQESLYEFALQHGGYRTSWKAKRIHKLHEMAGLALISDVVPTEIKVWLGKGDRAILPVVYQAVAGHESPEFQVVYEIVHGADKESVAANLTRTPVGEGAETEAEDQDTSESKVGAGSAESEREEESASSGKTKAAIGSPATDRFERLLPDFLADRTWLVNQRDRERGLFWCDSEDTTSVWATWPALYSAINRAFTDQGFKSFPSATGVFFDMLESAGIVEKTNSEYVWPIEVQQDSGKLKLKMARIVSKDIQAIIRKHASKPVKLEILNPELMTGSESVPVTEAGPEDHQGVVEPQGAPEPEATEQNTSQQEAQGPVTEDQVKAPTGKSKAVAPDQSPKPLSVSDYISDLDNADLTWLREDAGEGGEILEEICSALAHGKITDFGVLGGCLYLKWPASAKALGDDPKIITADLMSDRLLLTASNSDFDVKPTGYARVQVKGKPMTVIALSKVATRRMRSAYGFDEHFQLNLEGQNKKPVPEAEVAASETTAKKEDKKAEASVNTQDQGGGAKKAQLAAGESKKTPSRKQKESSPGRKEASEKTTSKSESSKQSDHSGAARGIPQRDVLNALDTFLAYSFDDYSDRVAIHGQTSIHIDSVSAIYRAACEQVPSLNQRWLGRFRSFKGVRSAPEGMPGVLVDSGLMPKTAAILKERERGD